MQELAGGCSCGAVRFSLKRPLMVLACHCDACKKRTGSAFGISIAVDDDAVTKFTGATTTFTRVGDSGKQVRYEFCQICGTTVRWRVELTANRQVFAGGALDDARRIVLAGEMYTDEALPWARLGCEITRPCAPDNTFRQELIQKTASLFS